jgi:hypothetical protein
MSNVYCEWWVPSHEALVARLVDLESSRPERVIHQWNWEMVHAAGWQPIVTTAQIMEKKDLCFNLVVMIATLSLSLSLSFPRLP